MKLVLKAARRVVTMINTIVVNAYQTLCITISHQLNNTVEWVNAKQDTKKRTMTSAIPARNYKLITQPPLHVTVMKDTIN